ncbi:MAG: dicarboxylate/amino acid:cation symporter [Treponema sp.]|nr:dicarboxylate/amino acid:cation symporter [Treponema sp.]
MEGLSRKSITRNYLFLGLLMGAIVLGCVVGALWSGATVLQPLGTVFINLMFCIVVPLVFCSIASSIANMSERKRVGKIMGTTMVVFLVTGFIACVIMITLMRIFPPVLSPWKNVPQGIVSEPADVSTLIVNFFTVSDFSQLLTRRAMLPLIVFATLFGFATSLSGGKDSMVGKFLDNMTEVMIKVVKLVTYYAPIAFFGLFAALVAEYGPQLIGDYGRAMAVYYPLCLIYIFTAFPLFAWFGGGKGAIRVMFKYLFRPVITALGTCSSVATMPTNMDVAKETGISKEITDIVMPLGANLHMDGSCFSAVLKIAFLFGVFGIPFEGIGLMTTVIIVALLSSVAMSGIPGGGHIGEFVVCLVFFPDNMAIAYPIAITIGNLVDPPATMINASGDYVVSFIVSRFVTGKEWLQNALVKKAA